jgi:hypothetical protein
MRLGRSILQYGEGERERARRVFSMSVSIFGSWVADPVYLVRVMTSYGHDDNDLEHGAQNDGAHPDRPHDDAPPWRPQRNNTIGR